MTLARMLSVRWSVKASRDDLGGAVESLQPSGLVLVGGWLLCLSRLVPVKALTEVAGDRRLSVVEKDMRRLSPFLQDSPLYSSLYSTTYGNDLQPFSRRTESLKAG